MFSSIETSLVRLKVSSQAKLADEERIENRKRNVLILILHHLQAHGYLSSVEKLQSETNLSLRKVTAADNMDLINIVQEFESYYQFKFGKPAKLVRKNTGDDATQSLQHSKTVYTANESPHRESALNTRGPPLPKISKQLHSSSSLFPKYQEKPLISPTGFIEHANTKPSTSGSNEPKQHDHISAVGTKVTCKSIANEHQLSTKSGSVVSVAPAAEMSDQNMHTKDDYDQKLLKPMPDYANSEFRELAAIITRDIFVQNPNVKWSDIAGLASSKRLIKEAIVFPIKFPSLFTGILKPWKGILMFGPPGTGKTMLAKAVATECQTTFFNISASSVVSKWRGDSEKLVRVLFELARYHAPSTIFLDELESIMGQRTSDGGEHEGSRRMKTELLIQMDGLAKGNEHVFLLGASNLPWDLDVAMLRRLEKRILIDLPDKDSRKTIFQSLLPADMIDDSDVRVVGDLDYEALASLTKGYSGSDINLVCREAAMRPLRKIFDKLEAVSNKQIEASVSTASVLDYIQNETGGTEIARDAISQHDVVEAIRTTNPTCDVSLEKKYQDWQKSFSSV
ncbi:hypothetical protein BDEG_27093 [Batrachochytrium dendrobatidis JEL423]|uniref:Katanin p60 ATPase-containing subunit A-like 2 n=1 Tax=Batrachochytrium dendrobatidis (strain JEL423) TaxID=403673 RepID=A0A177WUL9_BATDL|nr:hypothetical protein BDEG_27093 [Batrachochytrium dendrobatidis JEL423]